MNRKIAILLGLILSALMIAQNNTNSPYTRYGYGQLEDGKNPNLFAYL